MCSTMYTCVSSGRKVQLFILRDSKMYTSGSIASSQRIATEINENGAIAEIRIQVENDTVKHLKAFRIISSKMPISLLILN